MAFLHAFSVAQLANALALASLLTILASGLALIFGLRDVMNFAHGALFMLGAYIGYSVSGLLDFWAALVVAPVALACWEWRSSTRRSARCRNVRGWTSRWSPSVWR